MPAAKFCREEGVSRAGFYAWRRRLEAVEPTEGPAIEFVELPASSGTTPIVLEVGEVVVRLGRGVDGADLRTVLAALEERR